MSSILSEGGSANMSTWLFKSRRLGLLVGLLLLVTYLILSQDWSRVRRTSSTSRIQSEAEVSLLFGNEKPSAGPPSSPPPPTAIDIPAPYHLPIPNPPSWNFDPSHDRDNHALTAAQCVAEFPDLYYEIDRAAAFWKTRNSGKKLVQEQWNVEWALDGGLTAMIHDNQLYITFSRGLNHFQHWKERSHATLHQIHRALLASKEPVPNIEFSMRINDKVGLDEKLPNTTVWAFSRNISDPVMEQVWLMPDFNFWSYPRVAGAFGNFQREGGIDVGDDFDNKINMLVWRGTTAFNPQLRKALLSQTDGRHWSDVHNVVEDAHDDKRITMTDHCRYKYAVHTEGTTWSGRLKYLLSCHSVIFVHTLTHYTHLYHLLEPFGPTQNYVSTSRDWADLPGKVEELLTNPGKARMIADNAAAKFRDRYFTPAAQTCYWRRLFQVWSEVTELPDPYEYWQRSDGKIERFVRGMTYEEYVFWDKNVPEDAS